MLGKVEINRRKAYGHRDEQGRRNVRGHPKDGTRVVQGREIQNGYAGWERKAVAYFRAGSQSTHERAGNA